MPLLPAALPFPFYTGTSSVSSLVPGIYPAALNGRPLMIDDREGSGWRHAGIQLLRQQADASTQPSERSLNPEGLWRRSMESWHRGAGQTHRDMDDSDPFRFLESKGIDVWTPRAISLLHDTDQKKASANTNVRLCVAGSRLYCADGSTLTYTEDVTVDSPTWNAVTYAGGTILSIVSDGFNVYLTDGTNNYLTATNITTTSTGATDDIDLLGYAKGRLLGAEDGEVFQFTATNTAASLFIPDLTAANFTWVGFAAGRNAIYMAGYTGDKSIIWRVAIQPDGTSLSAPTVAGELPDGEVVSSIAGYLGFILIGTTRGIRFCEADDTGNLTIGPLIDLGVSVLCFEGQGNFVWFGWTNYDSESTGLGRLDLRQFTIDIDTGGRVPAYASDLMAADTGAVLSVVTFQNIRVFSVSESGVWGEASTRVTSGTLTSGHWDFGLPDEKNVTAVDVRTDALVGSYAIAVAVDSETAYTQAGTEDDAGDTGQEFPVETGSGREFGVQLTLTRDGSDTTASPTITRVTLKAAQGAIDGPAEYLFIPFFLYRELILPNGETVHCNVAAERDAIKALRRSKQVVTYQGADATYEVQVENFEWTPEGLNFDAKSGQFVTPNGVMLTQLKRIS